MPTKTVIAAVLALAVAVPSAAPVSAPTGPLRPTPPSTSSQAPADVVFRNEDVYTMDPQRPWARGVAVRRRAITSKGAPAGGWFPDQQISVAEALRAYTINREGPAQEE